jgi:hypothetical protein
MPPLLFSILALLCLLFAFGVLLCTFVWIARLLARRAEEAEQRRLVEDAGGGEVDEEESDAEEAEEEEEPSPEDLELEDLKKKGGMMKTNATLGLVFAILSCLLVSMGPLILTLTIAAFYFCGQALWIGLRYFRVFVGRAAVGIVVGAGGVMLQYLALTGQLTQLIPILG